MAFLSRSNAILFSYGLLHFIKFNTKNKPKADFLLLKMRIFAASIF